MSLQGLKVLVVDDDETARLLIKSMLAESGVDAQAVPNGKDAVGALRDASSGHPFDAAIVDCRMPEMDGGNVAMVVEADATIPPVQLILLSSANQLHRARAARPPGISGYLPKPVRKAELQECLATVMGDESYAPDESSTMPQSRASLDPEAVRSLKALDREPGEGVFHRVVKLYLSRSEGEIGEIRAAIKSADAECANDLVHGLKGSSATLGANRLADICAGIEQLIRAGDWPGALFQAGALEAEFRHVRGLLSLEL